MPNDIVGSWLYNRSDKGKVTLDCVDIRFHRESGNSVEPESLEKLSSLEKPRQVLQTYLGLGNSHSAILCLRGLREGWVEALCESPVELQVDVFLK